MAVTGGAYAGTANEQLVGKDAPAFELPVPKAARSVDNPVTGDEAYKKLEKMYAEGKDIKLWQMPDGTYQGRSISKKGEVDIVESLEKRSTLNPTDELLPNLITGRYSIRMKFAIVAGKEWIYSGTGQITDSSFVVYDGFDGDEAVSLTPRTNGDYVILKTRNGGYIYLVKK
jgi:hypothetical protein